MYKKINSTVPTITWLKKPLLALGLVSSLWFLGVAPSASAAQCYYDPPNFGITNPGDPPPPDDSVLNDCTGYGLSQTIVASEDCFVLLQGGIVNGVREYSPQSANCNETRFGGTQPVGTPPAQTPGAGPGEGSEYLASYQVGDCQTTNGGELDESNCGIIAYLVIGIRVLSGLVAVVVVGSIIYGGIQYSSAGSEAQKVSAAKERIRNSIIALFFFIFMFGFLNYLVPGGVL